MDAVVWEPAARRGVFDLYHHLDRLIYVKEPCAAADTAGVFMLDLIPADLSDLPTRRRAVGFENRDFSFADYGRISGDRCVAIVPLPDYPLRAIRTGQYVP